MLQNEEFIHEFIEEAIAHIEVVENNLLHLEGQDMDRGLVDDIFRAVHSIKGTAGFFGLDNIVRLAHTMENLFGEIRSENLELTSNMIDAILECNDMLRAMVQDVEKSSDTDITVYVDMIDAFLTGDDEKTVNRPALGGENMLAQNLKHGHKIYIAKVSLSNDLEKNNITPMAFFNNITSIGNIIESKTDISHVEGLKSVLGGDIELVFVFTSVLDRELTKEALGVPNLRIDKLHRDISMEDIHSIMSDYYSIEERETESLPEKARRKGTAASQLVEESIRVNLNLLNDLMNLASELVLGRNRLLSTME
ncbi:MAG: hypothetical protein GX974_10285, partial [Clostridiales bacterium]|nr:hypothetical protein [Clostridiales bacterium]